LGAVHICIHHLEVTATNESLQRHWPPGYPEFDTLNLIK
jgi:hypothetical protein